MDFSRTVVESPNRQQVLLCCGFFTNGASNPASFIGNLIQSVTRTGAGALTVTLKAQYKGIDLFGRFAQLNMAAPSDSKVVLKAYDKTAGTLTLETFTGAAAADIAAAADNFVSLLLVARYGSVPEGAVYDS